jgi:hypothetical protein
MTRSVIAGVSEGSTKQQQADVRWITSNAGRLMASPIP